MKEKKRTETPAYTVPALEQACQVLLCLEKSSKSRMTLTEISKEVGIHKSKGYSILNILKQFALVEKNPDTKAYLTTFRTSFIEIMVTTSFNRNSETV
jgi:DNA-binding IclR family transcriptional regulator